MGKDKVAFFAKLFAPVVFGLIIFILPKFWGVDAPEGCPSGNSETGGAWLSSARVVRCWVKSRNERNPYL